MTVKNYKWLSHLEESLPKNVHGYRTTMYAIALEGWRRGLTITFKNFNRNLSNTTFELINGRKNNRFRALSGELITREAIRTCTDKFKTKEYLLKNNVPTPQGKLFDKNSNIERILSYAEEISYPLVVKPVSGTGGKGVIAGINNREEFEEALKFVRDKLGNKRIIVEKHFEGEDYRVYVAGGEAVAITRRIPANVVGNGKDTIRKLISKKNQERKKSPILGASPIRIDNELKNVLTNQNLDLDSIASKGTRVILKSKSNISAGGDPVDITDEVSPEIKKIAVDACKAIPGLPHAGVDVMVDEKNNTGVVLEINSRPSLRTRLFPMEGYARDIPKKLIDYYFPQTTSNPDCPLYFDINFVWNEFEKDKAQEIVLPKIENGNYLFNGFFFNGKFSFLTFDSRIRRKARELGVNGYVEHLSDGTVKIIACGTKEEIEQLQYIIKNDKPSKAVINNVKVEKIHSRVQLGFYIKNVKFDRKLKDGYYPVQVKDPQRKVQKKKRKVKKSVARKETINYKKEYEKLINSTSWKVTKPLRKIGRLFK